MRSPAGDHPLIFGIGQVALRATGPLVTGDGLVVVGAVPVPYLPAGVARVGQDLRDRPQRPCVAVAVLVAGRVVAGRAGYAALVEGAGDRGGAAPGQALREDPPDMRRGDRIGIEPVQPAAPPGMYGVGVWTGVDQPVPVGWSATQVPALVSGLGRSWPWWCGTGPAVSPGWTGDPAASSALGGRDYRGRRVRSSPATTTARRTRPAQQRCRIAGRRGTRARTHRPPPRRTAGPDPSRRPAALPLPAAPSKAYGGSSRHSLYV
jgi:hypothetical protein